MELIKENMGSVPLILYKISEKIKPKGRQMGWRKNKENRPL